MPLLVNLEVVIGIKLGKLYDHDGINKSNVFYRHVLNKKEKYLGYPAMIINYFLIL